MDTISQLESDIKSLKIQGATNVALKVIEGLTIAVNRLKTDKNLNPQVYLLEETKRLAFTRPTEPLAQNALRYIFQKKLNAPDKYLKKAQEYKKMMENAKIKMGKSGSDLIKNGGIYLTHCHSSTVTNMFMEAHKSGKKFSVLVTETRPLFQGRITARELISAGIDDVTMIIDDMAPSIILTNTPQISAVFIGSDLLSKDGFVNKVGSLGIAYLAYEKKIRLYTLSILLKYDPENITMGLIEKRDYREIWPEAPSGLKFLSPAFDFIPYYENISLITEEGILKTNEVTKKALTVYPFLNSDIIGIRN